MEDYMKKYLLFILLSGLLTITPQIWAQTAPKTGVFVLCFYSAVFDRSTDGVKITVSYKNKTVGGGDMTVTLRGKKPWQADVKGVTFAVGEHPAQTIIINSIQEEDEKPILINKQLDFGGEKNTRAYTMRIYDAATPSGFNYDFERNMNICY
jgi:hypothetical protein